MKTSTRGARTHNLPKSRQTRFLFRHIAVENIVLKDDNYETPRGSLDMRIAYLPIHLFRCVDETGRYIFNQSFRRNRTGSMSRILNEEGTFDNWGIPRQIEPDFRIFCTTICDFDETWSVGYF